MRFHARVAIGNIAEPLTLVRLLINYLFWVDILQAVWYNIYIYVVVYAVVDPACRFGRLPLHV